MFHSWSRRQLQSRSGCYHHFPFPGELDTHLPHALYPQESENILKETHQDPRIPALGTSRTWDLIPGATLKAT